MSIILIFFTVLYIGVHTMSTTQSSTGTELGGMRRGEALKSLMGGPSEAEQMRQALLREEAQRINGERIAENQRRKAREEEERKEEERRDRERIERQMEEDRRKHLEEQRKQQLKDEEMRERAEAAKNEREQREKERRQKQMQTDEQERRERQLERERRKREKLEETADSNHGTKESVLERRDTVVKRRGEVETRTTVTVDGAFTGRHLSRTPPRETSPKPWRRATRELAVEKDTHGARKTSSSGDDQQAGNMTTMSMHQKSKAGHERVDREVTDADPLMHSYEYKTSYVPQHSSQQTTLSGVGVSADDAALQLMEQLRGIRLGLDTKKQQLESDLQGRAIVAPASLPQRTHRPLASSSAAHDASSSATDLLTTLVSF